MSDPVCESCGKPATGYSLDEVPLCNECARELGMEKAPPEYMTSIDVEPGSNDE